MCEFGLSRPSSQHSQSDMKGVLKGRQLPRTGTASRKSLLETLLTKNIGNKLNREKGRCIPHPQTETKPAFPPTGALRFQTQRFPQIPSTNVQLNASSVAKLVRTPNPAPSNACSPPPLSTSRPLQSQTTYSESQISNPVLKPRNPTCQPLDAAVKPPFIKPQLRRR